MTRARCRGRRWSQHSSCRPTSGTRRSSVAAAVRLRPRTSCSISVGATRRISRGDGRCGGPSRSAPSSGSRRSSTSFSTRPGTCASSPVLRPPRALGPAAHRARARNAAPGDGVRADPAVARRVAGTSGSRSPRPADRCSGSSCPPSSSPSASSRRGGATTSGGALRGAGRNPRGGCVPRAGTDRGQPVRLRVPVAHPWSRSRSCSEPAGRSSPAVRSHDRAGRIVGAVAAVAVLCWGSVGLAIDVYHASTGDSPAERATASLSRQLLDHGVPSAGVILRLQRSSGFQLMRGIHDELLRHDRRVFVDEDVGYQFGDGRAATPADVGRVWWVADNGAAIAELSSRPRRVPDRVVVAASARAGAPSRARCRLDCSASSRRSTVRTSCRR